MTSGATALTRWRCRRGPCRAQTSPPAQQQARTLVAPGLRCFYKERFGSLLGGERPRPPAEAEASEQRQAGRSGGGEGGRPVLGRHPGERHVDRQVCAGVGIQTLPIYEDVVLV